MKRKYYILILILLSVNFWYLKPIGGFLVGNMGLFVNLAIVVLGGVYFYFKNKKPRLFLKKGYLSLLMWIYIGVLLSFIPAYLNFGQGFVTSLFASKTMFLYLTFPVLLIVRPSFNDIKWALYMFSFLYIIVAVFDSIIGLPIIEKIDDVNVNTSMNYIYEGDIIHTLEGFQLVALAFIFSLDDLRRKFTTGNVLMTAFLFAILLIVQNRSSLFPCTILLVYTLFTIKSRKYKVVIRVSALLCVAVMFAFTLQSWTGLFLETADQLGNKDYNRNLAWAYFLTEASKGPLEYVLGNGFLSTKSTSHMQDMMGVGVFNSDVGFIGMWNQYGLIPIIVFAIVLCRVVFGRKYSYLLKCNAWFIIMCSLTIAYFIQQSTIVWACLFLYMCCYEQFLAKRRKLCVVISDKMTNTQ